MNRMRFLTFLILTATLHSQPPAKLIVIGIDGFSVNVIDKAKMPNLKALIARAAFTLKARGVLPTVSSPNWASILMGAGPEQHGVTSNDWQRDKFEIDPLCTGVEGIFPNIFGVLHAARPSLHLAAIYDWDGFGRLFDRSAANHAERVLHSEQTTQAAITYWLEKKPDFLFVHLDDVDHAGHNFGWESDEYIEAASRIDILLGKLFEAVAKDNAFIIIVADHGGTGKKHGSPTRNELLIPVIFAGPGVKPREFKQAVNNYDVAPTIAAVFGVALHPCWIGKPLLP